jgi:hypothetical protein
MFTFCINFRISGLKTIHDDIFIKISFILKFIGWLREPCYLLMLNFLSQEKCLSLFPSLFLFVHNISYFLIFICRKRKLVFLDKTFRAPSLWFSTYTKISFANDSFVSKFYKSFFFRLSDCIGSNSRRVMKVCIILLPFSLNFK